MAGIRTLSEARIGIIQDNIRQLIEQAAAVSGAENEAFVSDRIAQQLSDLNPELEQFAMDTWRVPKADFPRSSAGSRRAASFRSAVPLPMGTTSNASSSESRPDANGPASRAG